MEQNAKSFSTAPKFSGYDMIVLNLDENNYVSSPYAKISDETKWTNQSNGKYTFTYDTSTSKWVRGSSSYTTAEMLSTWGIEIYFCSVSGLTDHAKAGDTVTVVKIKDNDPDANEKQVLQLTCEISRSGTRMEADCPLVKPAARQSVADTLLAQMYGYEYQPYSAQGAVVNPAVELGDAITAYGVYSGIYTQDLTFNSLMSSDISAPCDEEVDEEMEYESQQERAYTRKFADIAAEFLIKADEIAARVTREGTGEGFGWSLIESAFKIYKTSSPNRPVFLVDSQGLHVEGDGTFSGTIYATDGEFSGTITASDISGSTITGGSIKIGGTTSNPNFYVDSSGNLYAKNGTFEGTVHAGQIVSSGANDTMSGSYLTAGSIGYNSSGALGSSWYNGAVGGNNFSTMDVQGSYWADYVKANKQVICSGAVSGHHWSGAIQDSNGTQYATVWSSKSVLSGSLSVSTYCNYSVAIAITDEYGNNSYVYCPVNGYWGASLSGGSSSTIYYLGH